MMICQLRWPTTDSEIDFSYVVSVDTVRKLPPGNINIIFHFGIKFADERDVST